MRISAARVQGYQQLQSMWLANILLRLEHRAFPHDTELAAYLISPPRAHLEKMTQGTLGYSCRPHVLKMPCGLESTSKWEPMPWLSPALLSKGHGVCENVSSQWLAHRKDCA
jgi:hypothetical protein